MTAAVWRRRAPWARLMGSALALAGVALLVDVPAALARLRGLDPTWAAFAAALALPQQVLSAARWRFTAARVAAASGDPGAPAPPPLGVAVREYWLGTFLNQVLPGGVVGDVGRAVRHARGRGAGRWPVAARAVAYERASGQAALALVLVGGVAGGAPGTGLGVAVALLAVAGALAAGLPARVRGELRAAFVTDAAWVTQAALSVGLVATYVVGFALAAAAVGAPLGPGAAARLAPPILLAMAVPLSVAGWGVREGAAAAVYAAAGLDPDAGVAASATYGLVVLVGSLPGAVALALPAGPGRAQARDRAPG